MLRRLLFLACFFLGVANLHLSAQTYEEWIEKSCDSVDKQDWVSAEEALKNAMREEPGNPANFALYVIWELSSAGKGKSRRRWSRILRL